MEQGLTCNLQECNAQITGQAIVTVCSHAICVRCANSHGLGGTGPYSCPVCRQPLRASEFCEQLVHPSEEWKSLALSGLSPTVVMECAGRALSFWSYQMTNQISCQVQNNSKLKDYCTELQGEIENIWGQANQRISTLTTKIRDMEQEEHTLKRKCEELRLNLESRTRELSQSQELYSKLKQRVLHSQTPDIGPAVLTSRTAAHRTTGPVPAQGKTQSQIPRPAMSLGAKAAVPNYFPASLGHSRSQSNPSDLVEWNKPMFSQRAVPSTPSNTLPNRHLSTLHFTSAPRTGMVPASAPGPGRFNRTASGPQILTDGSRSFSGAKTGVAGLKRSFGGSDPDLSKRPLDRVDGSLSSCPTWDHRG